MPLMSQIPPASPQAFRYLEGRPPIVFAESAEVPETLEHHELRMLLYLLLLDTLGSQVAVGSDQFVYFDAEDPKQVLAPDVYVRLSPAAIPIRSWKVWERGAPDVCVEIVSESDASEAAWQQKLSRYRQLGTRELVRFDPAHAEQRLRVWDRVEGRLLERESSPDVAPSPVLGVDWVVGPCERWPRALRIARDGVLVATRLEAKEDERRAKEEERRAKEEERRAREAAEARVRELEAELARRGS